jgi:trehalose/maltose hydrolase-like predicted phosphorylase
MKKRPFSIIAFLISTVIFQPASAQNNSVVDPWVITAELPDPSNYYGVTVANGMIGIVSSPQPFQVKDVVLAGAYDLYGRGRVSNFLKSFNLLNMRFNVDGTDISSKNISSLKQTLDMHQASFTTTFSYLDKAEITYTYYALRQLPFTVLMDITVKAKKDIQITPASIMEAPDALRDVQNYYNEIDRPHALISLLTSTAKSPTGKLLMCASNTFLFTEPRGQEPRLIHEMWDNNMHLLKFSHKIGAGETYRFSIVGSSITSAHDEDPLNEAERLTIFAKLQGADRLIYFHEKAWNDVWTSDIQIEGDPQSQQDIHSMLYHLYSFTREGTSFSLSPMGLSGLGYNGHVFWDADLWMFPALLVMHPGMAKSMIEYRYESLDAARKNAFAHGYKGAMFPWESAGTGVEETPVWALSGPFEHHITACVGLAAWNYYCVTQDKKWLLEKGWPIISATADFWASRVERNGPGQYDINNVVAADEWAENIDNNAFTNGAAKVLLKDATEAAKILGLHADPDWMLVSNNIPVLQFNGITREHSKYNGEGIKQADVNLLAYPLKLITDPVQVKKDLVYYQSRVPNQGTPAMTQAIFALLYARMGQGDTAYHFFKDAYMPNLNPPFRVIAETKGGTNPYFATGAGGILQSVLMGFGGLDITTQGIVQLPSKLPTNWKGLQLKGIGPEKKNYSVK